VTTAWSSARVRALAAGAGAIALAGSLAVAAPPAAAGLGPVPAPLFGGGDGSGYVVVLKDDAGTVPAAVDRARDLGAQIQQQFTALLQGYAAQFSATELDRVRRDPAVAFVQENRRYSVATTTQTLGKDRNWGLDRIDQRKLTKSGTYRYTTTGRGVNAYVLDTGITQGHPDFGNRVATGVSFVDDGNGTNDCDGIARTFFGVNPDAGEGHGTHVAGTIGGTRYGVAKAVRLVPVRVLDCQGNGSTRSLVAGLDWVRAHRGKAPAVANLSLGATGRDRALDAAVRKLISSGVTVVNAAGNGDEQGRGQDACRNSPADVKEAVVVGATDRKDKRAPFSDFGPCVDLNAPGVNVTSDYVDVEDGAPGTITFSGTSMAAPFVSGAVARYLQAHPRATPAAVQKAVTAAATKKIIKGKAPNSLLYIAP
jgi:subtilisin family serine protease